MDHEYTVVWHFDGRIVVEHVLAYDADAAVGRARNLNPDRATDGDVVVFLGTYFNQLD
jgi:hypothetical protein